MAILDCMSLAIWFCCPPRVIDVIKLNKLDDAVKFIFKEGVSVILGTIVHAPHGCHNTGVGLVGECF